MEWLLVAMLGGNLIWTTLCLGGYRPETMLITSLLTAVTLVVHLVGCALCRRSLLGHWVGWLFLPFLAYAAINVHWLSPVRWLGWHDWYFWANAFVVFWVVLNGVRHRAPQLTLMGCAGVLVVIATIMACYQRFVRPEWLMLGREQADQFLSRSSGPFGIPNSLAAFYLLVLPVLLGLTFRRQATVFQRVLFGYVALCALFGLFLTVSRGGWLALLMAFTAWPLLAGAWPWWRRLLAAIAAAAALLLMGWGLYSINPEVKARFHASVAESGEWTRPIMWRGAWVLFKSSPWTGTGAGSYNVLFEKHRPEKYQMEPRWAHNDYLNTLSDYGLIGFVLLFGVGAGLTFAGMIRDQASERDKRRTANLLDEPWWRGALGVGLLAFMVQLFVDFHFKIPALGMLFAVSAALLVGRVWPPVASRAEHARWSGGLAAVTVAILAVIFVYPHHRAEALRYGARQAMDKLWQYEPTEDVYRDILAQARLTLARACEIDPTHAQAWSDRALAEALWSHVAPKEAAELGVSGETYADRALALSQVNAEFWIRRAVSRNMQGKWAEAGEDMAQAMALASANAQVWFYQGYHLSLQTATKAMARAAFDYCLQLDPGNLTAQRLRQKLATSQ